MFTEMYLVLGYPVPGIENRGSSFDNPVEESESVVDLLMIWWDTDVSQTMSKQQSCYWLPV